MIAIASVGVAGIALARSCATEDQQQQLERQVEERQSVPLLVPGVEQSMRSGRRTFQIAGSYKRVKKLSNFLLVHWDKEKPDEEPFIVVPVRNVGEGVAIVLNEEARVLRWCSRATLRIASGRGLERVGERLGFYVVRPGESEQLYLAPRGSDAATVAEEYRWASRQDEISILIRYTDQLVRRLRWTCITYSRGSLDDERWSIKKPVYGDRDTSELDDQRSQPILGSG